MAKYKHKKHKKYRYKINGSINPCAEIALGESQISSLRGLWEAPQDGHYNITHSALSDTNDIREIGQATALIRPGNLRLTSVRPDASISIEAGASTGIQPTFSNAYRRRDESFQDIVDRVGEFIVAGGDRRSAVVPSTATDAWIAHGRNSSWPSSVSSYQDLHAGTVQHGTGNGNDPFADTEETPVRDLMALIHPGNRNG